MKKLFYVGALSALLLVACGEDTKKEANKVTEVENSTAIPSEQTGQNTNGTPTKVDILSTTVSLKRGCFSIPVHTFRSANTFR